MNSASRIQQDQILSDLPRPWRAASLVVSIAAAYLLAAWLGWLFAPESPFTAPFALAAGVALVALIACGARLWPAIWLASFAANLFHQIMIPGNQATPVALAALIAAGAALQAVLGARLVRRFVEVADPLAQERHTLCFLVLAGPLACLVSATVGVAGLYFLQGLPAEALAANWIVWWAGDSLSVLLFAPLVLLVLPASRRQWRERALQIAMPLLVTGALVVVGYVWMNLAEEAAHRKQLADVVEEVHHDLDTALTRDIGSVQALASLFDASKQVTRTEFDTVSRSAMQWSDVQALAWIPRVPRAQREAVEAAARRDGVGDFVFRERDSDNRQLVPAGERAEYYPALYIATREGKQSAALGFDAGAAAASRATLQRATDNARPVLADREAFFDRDTARSDDWRLYVPVYHTGFDPQVAGVEARREALRGFTVGVFYINKRFAPLEAQTGLQRIGYRLSNLSDPGSTRLLLERAVPAARATQPDTSRRIEGLAGNSLLLETWSLVPWHPAQSVTGRIHLLASVFITLLVAVFVLAGAGQGVRIAREVSRRTAALERELEVRRRTEEALAAETGRLSLALMSSNLSMWETDVSTCRVILDGQWATMMGEEPGQDRITTTFDEFLMRVPTEDRERVRTVSREAVAGGLPHYQVEHKVRTKTGEWRWIQSHGKVVEWDAQGRALRLIGTTLDITERKQVEETILRLNADLRQFKNTLDQTLDGIFMFRPDTLRFTYVNRGALVQMGYTEAELLQMTVVDIKPALTEDSFRKLIRPLLDGTQASVGFETLHRHKDGHDIPVEITLQLVHQSDGQSTFVAVVRDLTEKKRFDAALSQSEERLRSILDNTDAFIGEMTPDGVLVEINRTALEISGRRREEFIGKPLDETYFFNYSTSVQAGMRDAIQRAREGETVRYDLRARVGENRFITIDFMLIPVADAGGRIVKLVPSAIDITERTRAEAQVRELNQNLECIVAERTAALRASERRFVNMFEYAPDAVVMVDTQGRIKLVNRQAEALFGYGSEELVGQAVEMLIPEGSRPQHASLRQEFFSKPQVRSMGAGRNLLAMRKDGSTFPANISLSPVEAEEGLLVAAAVRDVTELKEAAAKIEEQRQQLTEAQRLAHLGSRVWNLATDEVVCSDEYLRLHGLTPGEVEPSADVMWERVHPDDHKMLRQCFEQAFQDHRPYEVEYRVVWPDGTERWLHGRGEVSLDGAGQPVLLSGTEQDITEQRKHQAERQARATAEQANQAKSAFLAMMSHEIRTPMNGVLGMLEVLQHSNLTEYQRDQVQTMRSSGDTLLSLIDDILDFSKIEAGRIELEQASLCVADLVEGLCTSQLSVARQRGVALRMYVDPDLPERVLGDDTRVRQVLYNLVGNAIKFSAGNPARCGRVTVRATLAAREPLCIAFTIEDNGIGMDETAQARLFAPFTQAESSTTRRFGGTGLGLSICRRLANLMRGKIRVQSRPGEGSLFTVTLPFDLAPEQPLREQPDLSGLACCLLDDAYLDAGALTRYLEHAGASVQRCADIGEVMACATAYSTLVLIHAEDASQCWQDGALPAQLRRVRIGRGRRRRARLDAPDCVSLDGDALLRQTFLRAVAVAAGRASPEIFGVRSTGALPGESTPPPTVAQARAENRLILIAEDDSLNQKVALQQLALLGYAAEVASDGAEALARWEDGGFALLLTDLHMPAMDGYQLAAEIRRREDGSKRRMPIIALTANALRGEAARAKAAGMDEYLTKPVALSLLREVLEAWLSQENAVSETASSRTNAAAPVGALDVTVLRRLVGADPAILHDFLTEYARSAAEAAAELRATAATKDHAQLAAIAHKLKSSSRSVGALPLGDLCAELENIGKCNNGAAVAHCMAQFETLYAEVEEKLAPLLSEEKKR